ncbi:MAG: ABC transporter transmembrane domain-containing protein, partial [Pseudomonadota bacterium]|nr:ABC transporter transmembrane domain-containing protein [Pseudomonadota bacterium]
MNSETPDSMAPRGGDWALYRRLLRYLKGQWFLFFVAVIGFLLGAGSEAFFAQVLGQVVDSFDSNSDVHIWYFPSLIVIAALVRAFGSITGELLLSRISFRVVHVLRCELFDQLLVVPSEFFEASAQGQIVSRLTFTTAQLRDTATDALKIIFQDGGKLIVLLGFMFWQNWLLTAIFLLVTPLVGGVVRYASKRFRRISERIQSSMGDVTHVASEAVTGYRVMRAFGGEKYEQGRFLLASDRNRRQNLKMVATKAFSAQVIQVFVAVSIGGLIGLVFQPDIVGAMTKGELITYIGLAGLLASPIKRLSDVNARLQRGLAAASDVFSQIDQDAERNEGTHVGDRVRGKVEFRNISFRYSANQHDSLSDINITIQPGQTIALVGRSGGGKSTLVSLLARFYEPTNGEIRLDEIPVTQYELGNLRQQIALVSQEVVLFNDTLRANV